MEKLILVNSCMRAESSTRRLMEHARMLLAERYDIEEIDVNAMALTPVTPEIQCERSAGKVAEHIVAMARRIAAADRIVVAAPFWDMSFPSVLKAFIENMSLYNVTFTDNGKSCVGLCRCERMLYVTTRGMDIATGSVLEQGSTYLQALSALWGCGEVITVAAHNLTIVRQRRRKRDLQKLSRSLLSCAGFSDWNYSVGGE